MLINWLLSALSLVIVANVIPGAVVPTLDVRHARDAAKGG